jgi:hypothetical protein
MKSARFTSSAAFSTSFVLYALRAQPDIPADRPAEQEWILQHHAEAAAQIGEVHVFHIDPVDPDRSLLHVVEPQQQRDQRGLASARVPDNSRGFAGFDREADIAQHPVGVPTPSLPGSDASR